MMKLSGLLVSSILLCARLTLASTDNILDSNVLKTTGPQITHDWQEVDFVLETGWVQSNSDDGDGEGTATYEVQLAFTVEPKYALREQDGFSLMWLTPTRNVFEFEQGLVHYAFRNRNLLIVQTMDSNGDFDIMQNKLTSNKDHFYKIINQKGEDSLVADHAPKTYWALEPSLSQFTDERLSFVLKRTVSIFDTTGVPILPGGVLPAKIGITFNESGQTSGSGKGQVKLQWARPADNEKLAPSETTFTFKKSQLQSDDGTLPPDSTQQVASLNDQEEDSATQTVAKMAVMLVPLVALLAIMLS